MSEAKASDSRTRDELGDVDAMARVSTVAPAGEVSRDAAPTMVKLELSFDSCVHAGSFAPWVIEGSLPCTLRRLLGGGEAFRKIEKQPSKSAVSLRLNAVVVSYREHPEHIERGAHDHHGPGGVNRRRASPSKGREGGHPLDSLLGRGRVRWLWELPRQNRATRAGLL